MSRLPHQEAILLSFYSHERLWGIQGVLDLPHSAVEETEAQTGLLPPPNA